MKSKTIFQTLFEIIFYLIVLIIVFTAIIVLIIVFADKKIDTTNLTNIGFAMAVSMSSVCFSYYKIFTSSQNEIGILRIQISGQGFLLAAVTFVFSSFLKYIDIHSEYVPLWTKNSNFLNTIFHGAYWFILVVSVFLFVDSMVSIAQVLFKYQWKAMGEFADKRDKIKW